MHNCKRLSVYVLGVPACVLLCVGTSMNMYHNTVIYSHQIPLPPLVIQLSLILAWSVCSILQGFWLWPVFIHLVGLSLFIMFVLIGR